MITDPAIAKQISDLMVEFLGRLDASAGLVKDNCPEEEFLAYRHQVGQIMGNMVVEIMMPLYNHHPAIKPPFYD